MNHFKKIAVGVVAAGLVAGVLLHPQHVGPAYLYPNPTLTPGLVATADIKLLTATNPTYSQSHRKTTEGQKDTVCKEYPTACASPHEIDHFCPLAIGCADDVKNLWAQPETNMWNGVNYGFHEKDRLESLLAVQVKNGTMSPRDAQQCILKDWVACYRQTILGDKFRAITELTSTDPDY